MASQLKSIALLSQSEVKHQTCADFFGDGHRGAIKGIKFQGQTPTPVQPLGLDDAKKCIELRIQDYLSGSQTLSGDHLIIAIENFIDLDKKTDFALVAISEAHHKEIASYAIYSCSFGIDLDDHIVEQLRSMGNNVMTGGQLYAQLEELKGKTIDHANWMRDLKGIDRVDQIGNALMKAWAKFNNLDEKKFYPNYPILGVNFIDVFPFLNKTNNKEILVRCTKFHYLRKFQSKSAQIDRSIPLVIAGVESKGFLTGPVILVPAFESFFKECQFLPVRKKGKLPGETIQSNDYETEYSKGNQLEVMIDHFPESKKKVYMIITDDILATGGTIHATIELMKKVEKEKGIEIEILDLFFLDSIKELEEHPGRKQLLSDGFPSRTFLLPMIEN